MVYIYKYIASACWLQSGLRFVLDGIVASMLEHVVVDAVAPVEGTIIRMAVRLGDLLKEIWPVDIVSVSQSSRG